MENASRLVDTEKFNTDVRFWSITTRTRMVRRAPDSRSEKPFSEKLLGTEYFVNMNRDGEASNVKFLFPRHGVFVHYGVGRGWIRVGNNIMRGNLTASARRSKRKNRNVNLFSGPGKGRKAVDWFDIEIKHGIGQLADIAQEYFGDKAMHSVLDKTNRFLIEK